METLAHGITPLMRGLILQPRAPGLAHSPATTHPKTQLVPTWFPPVVPPGSHVAPSTHKLPISGHPNINLLARGGLSRDKEA